MADTIEIGGATASPEEVSLLNTGLAAPEGGAGGSTKDGAKDAKDVEAAVVREPGEEAHEEDEDVDADAPTGKRDTELEGAGTEEDRAAIQERRRNERRQRNERRRERIDTLERTNKALTEGVETLRTQVASLTNFATGMQLQQLDADIAQAEQANQYFKTLAADATTKGDGVNAVESTEKAAFAAKRATDLKAMKSRFTQASTQPAPSNPQVAKRATEFVAKHTWYKGPGDDPDSAVLATLDNAVAKAGFDPLTDAYWEELEARGKKYLPHRFSTSAGAASGDNGGQGAADPKRVRQPVPGSGGNGGSNSGKETFRLSEARVQAMKDSGNWDDIAKRNKMIANYRAHDAANKA